MTTRYLHVANGTSVTRTLEAAGVPGQRSIWADPLHEGPVPAGLSDDELLEVRRQYLAGTGGSPATTAGHPSRDPVNDMRRWREVIARRESYDELVLWFEHDLFDQLNLIQALTWIRAHVPGTTVSLICIDSFPGHPNFKGLGELSASELAPLLDQRSLVTAAHYELAARAWEAFRQPTPEALDALRRQPTSMLPFLSPAITRLLHEYPWTSDGLSRAERRLLQVAAEGPLTLSEAFAQLGDGDRFFTMTDLSLLDRVRTFTQTSPALMTLDASGATERLFRAVIAVTDAGRSVIQGTLDRVDACGIDKWIGGVHLQGRSRLWRWNDARQHVERC